jgi:integrase
MNTEKLSRELKQEELEPFAQQYPETVRWLRKIESSVSRNRYTRSLMRYCETAEKTPSELIALKKNSKDHDAEDLLDEFVESAQKANYPNSMIWDIAISVKSFYKWNYQDLSRGAGKITLVKVKPYRTPDKETLLKFLEGAHMRDKALISLVACTGISEGSLPQLKWRHIWSDLIEKNLDIPHIGLTSVEIKGKGKGKYEGVQQVTFLTPYARKALLNYREWREIKEKTPLTPESYMFVTVTKKKPKENEPPSTPRPLTIGNISRIFKQRSTETGIKFSPHDLRRFVQTGLETARLQPNWIKKILRHKVSGEESPYSQPKIEELREAYATALPQLDLSEKSATNELEMRKRMKLDQLKTEVSPDVFTQLEKLILPSKNAKEFENALDTIREFRRGRIELKNLVPLRGTTEECKDGENCQLVVTEEQLEDHLKRGFRFMATLPSGKILVSNET